MSDKITIVGFLQTLNKLNGFEKIVQSNNAAQAIDSNL